MERRSPKARPSRSARTAGSSRPTWASRPSCEPVMALLELRGVDAFYGRIQALRGVSIDVGQGEVVVVIGSNGEGKTTTLRTLSVLMHPATGPISFNDRDLTRIGPATIVGRGIS